MQARLIKQEAERLLAEYRTHVTTLSAQDVASLSDRVVSLFFDYYQLAKSPLRASIELLCELNASPYLDHVSIGLEALFPSLIEKLNDAFLPSYCKLYDRVFTQVISFFRKLPEGQTIHTALNDFGLYTEADILQRKRTLNRRKYHLSTSRPLKKIIFLSRVTIGADIAVTSVMMAHLKQRFSDAELVLIGAMKLQQIFGGDPQIRVRPIDYARNSNLLSRLENWLQLIRAIEFEINDLRPEEFCVIDPDSRLTQLGLLPILPINSEAQSYLYFESRSFTVSPFYKLSQLASSWVQTICNDTRNSLPFVSLPSEQLTLGQKVFSFLEATDKRPVICLSFGVGGNALKRLSGEFETELVSLLSEKARLVIDSGASVEEQEQVGRLLSVLRENGKSIYEFSELQIPTHITKQFPDIITWSGNLGIFASLIASSNLYIGYDSAGQHIAAALKIPTLTIFINSGSHNFPLRWQPHGGGAINTILLSPSQIAEISTVIPDLLTNVLSLQELLLCESGVEIADKRVKRVE